VIPERHKEPKVIIEVVVVAKMKLWSIEKVAQRRELVNKQPMLTDDVRVTHGVNKVEYDQIGHHYDPVVLATEKKRKKHGGAKSCDVYEMLLEI
jgi:hypothetical protein